MSKKLLIREIFEKGKKESGRDSKSGIALYLSLYFYDEWKFEISERTFVRYYDAFLINKEDKNIDTQTLAKMSQFLGFQSYRDFCRTETFTKKNADSSFTSVKVSIDDEDDSDKKYPNITVNITTNPILKLQEFLAKQGNLGIFGVLLCGSLVLGSRFYKAEDQVSGKIMIKDSVFQDQIPVVENSTAKTVVYMPQNLIQISLQKELPAEKPGKYMYWNGENFLATENASLGSQINVVPMNDEKLKYFRKITTPDTITERSLDKVWYSKHQNVVEFFTADGVNPENGKELKILSQHMFEKYIKGK